MKLIAYSNGTAGELRPDNTRAFALTDVLAMVAGAAILGLVILPGLAQNNGGSELAVCSNNLRQLGQEWRAWADDHAQLYPWQVPVEEGGTMLSPNAWSHFLVLSNRLAHPRVVACPSDTRKPAAHFEKAPGGLAWAAGGENNAVSYFAGVHASYETPGWLMAGDRNLSGGRGWMNCRYLSGNVAYDMRPSPVPSEGSLAWTNSIHGPDLGNVVLSDGSVQTTTSADLNTLIETAVGESNSAYHILPPY